MTTRRLAAIIAADIAGYSRLMHADEERTHAEFTAIMKGSVEPALAGHGGRLVKSTGDGFLAEFPSALEAVRCALHFQEDVARLHAQRCAGLAACVSRRHQPGRRHHRAARYFRRWREYGRSIGGACGARWDFDRSCGVRAGSWARCMPLR